MGDQYSVHRSALHESVKYVEQVGDNWRALADSLNGAKLGSDDLGIIGKKANIISEYNSGVDHIWREVNKGAINLMKVALALETVAMYYGRADKKVVDEIRKAIQ